MCRAAARAASRRGSSITMRRPASHGSSSSASGTRVVLPAPGGACSTAAPCARERRPQLRERGFDGEGGHAGKIARGGDGRQGRVKG